MTPEQEIAELRQRIKHLEYAILLIQNSHKVGFLGICVNHALNDNPNHPHYVPDPQIEWAKEIIYHP